MSSDRRRILSRLLSRLENLAPDEPLPSIENGRAVGSAFRIGVTGPLGSGKSTLIHQLILWYRKKSFTVGVVAVDPTSPFTGGAVLGDRVRMSDLTLDEGVFIRSLATRGTTGGLAAGAIDAADVLDAFGFDRIILETVGVGQTEVDVVDACDATVLVLEPGSGDSIQAIKAGLMEIADIFIVNKKDLRGADRFINDVESALDLKTVEPCPPVLATLARTGDGVAEFGELLEGWYNENSRNGRLAARRAGQRKKRIKRAAEVAVRGRMWERITLDELDKAVNGQASVREAARKLAESVFSS